MNTEEDEFLAAWLRKRGIHIVEDNFGRLTLQRKRITAFKHYDVEPKHMEMWVANRGSYESINLHTIQGKGRRPLRSAVREWVIGI